MLAQNRLAAAVAVRHKNATLWCLMVVGIPCVLIGAERTFGQAECEVFCDGFLLGGGPRDTPEECLVLCTGSDGGLGCECGSLTDCLFGGVSIVETPVCGNGIHEGTEECDPGFDPFFDADCACTGQCQSDCTCPGPPPACEVFCDGGAFGICPGGGGCPQTAAECLGFCTGSDGGLGCECLSVTDCLFGGVSIVETPVCGNGIHEGTEECDPGVDPFGDADCACTGQCQSDCTCPGLGAVCGNNVREGTEQCDGTDDAACPGLCQSDCTCSAAPIPTVSEWGMVLLMLSLLVGIKLKFDRRPSAAASG